MLAETEDRNRVQAGDIVLLVGKDHREFMFKVTPGQLMQTHRGIIQHDTLIGERWGQTIGTHLNYPYQLLPPSLDQLVRGIRRNTQIIYPKEIGYLLMKMNVGPGTRIIEAGTGSGGLTLALARMVMPHGHVYTYEARQEMSQNAQDNLARLGLNEYVTFKVRDIRDGFDECGVDALFLDVREPCEYLEQAHAALKGGGFFGALVPTANQVIELLTALNAYPFGFIEVEELLLRTYKPVPGRFRPNDTMVGHTGFLTFARALIAEAGPDMPESEPEEEAE
mgnify:CR=1 FL=1